MIKEEIYNEIEKLTKSSWKRIEFVRENDKTLYICNNQKICKKIYPRLPEYIFFLNTNIEEIFAAHKNLLDYDKNYTKFYFFGKYFMQAKYHNLILYKLEDF